MSNTVKYQPLNIFLLSGLVPHRSWSWGRWRRSGGRRLLPSFSSPSFGCSLSDPRQRLSFMGLCRQVWKPSAAVLILNLFLRKKSAPTCVIPLVITANHFILNWTYFFVKKGLFSKFMSSLLTSLCRKIQLFKNVIKKKYLWSYD